MAEKVAAATAYFQKRELKTYPIHLDLRIMHIPTPNDALFATAILLRALHAPLDKHKRLQGQLLGPSDHVLAYTIVNGDGAQLGLCLIAFDSRTLGDFDGCSGATGSSAAVSFSWQL